MKIKLYFIQWKVYDSMIRTERTSEIKLAFCADYIVEGNKRVVKKDRTGLLNIDQPLSKSQLFVLIKGFEGIVVAR